jgi:hypothetical protein
MQQTLKDANRLVATERSGWRRLRYRCKADRASSLLANPQASVAGLGAGKSLALGLRALVQKRARPVRPRRQTFAPDIERGTAATSLRPSFPRPWQLSIVRRIPSRRFGRRPRLNRTGRCRARSPLRSPSMLSSSGRNDPYWHDSDHAIPNLIPRRFDPRHSRNRSPAPGTLSAMLDRPPRAVTRHGFDLDGVSSHSLGAP